MKGKGVKKSVNVTFKGKDSYNQKAVYGKNSLIYKKSEKDMAKNKKKTLYKSVKNFNNKFFSNINAPDSENESKYNENTQKSQFNSSSKKTFAKSIVKLNNKQNYNQGENLKKSKIQKVKEPSLKINQNEEKEENKLPIQQEKNEIMERPVELEKKEIEKLPESSKVKEVIDFCGFFIIKYEDGKKMFETKLDGDLNEINEILKKQNIEINNKEIEIIYKEELENLKHSNERIEEEYFKLREKYENERKEFLKQKELINQNENERKEKDNKENSLKASIRKKAKEMQDIQMEEDKLKIKEIKDRIQKYKDELNKGNAADNLKTSSRSKLLKKSNFNSDRLKESNHQKLIQLQKIEEKKELELKEKNNEDLNKAFPSIKENNLVNNNISKINANLNKSPVNNNINNNDKTYNQEKREELKIPKDNNKSNEPEKKDNKEKKYSKAMDRFKKRFKKGGDDDSKPKKSNKINEMAKQLENAIGKPQSPETREKIDSPEIISEGKNAEILESQALSINKVKKPHKPQNFYD